ncbi:Hypothetical protein, putative [Bodo saltans]|uniref:Uncharacterized protein n=1 Tax=Bodo saltans TaxID=75058 RepID=A0A0S4J0U2_BODSA|nr:Hypothetical protein, putative [Bodo saltans]|eukprot:CUG36039.1 Hypothetical protein, putative [Bodo saltans]
MVRLFDTPKSNPNLFRKHHEDPQQVQQPQAPNGASSRNSSVSSAQHPPLVELVGQDAHHNGAAATNNNRGGSVLPQQQQREFKLMTSPLPSQHHQRYPAASPSSPQATNAAAALPLVDLKSLIFDNVSAHVWSTRQNRFLLLDGPDKADIVSQRASVRMLKDAAQLLCGERGVVMEQLRPRDIASVHLHVVQQHHQHNNNNSPAASFSVAVHAHAPSAADEFDGRMEQLRPRDIASVHLHVVQQQHQHSPATSFSVAVHAHAPSAADEFDGTSFVRRLPNGVVLRGGHQASSDARNNNTTKRNGSAATWATVVIVCPHRDLAQRLHDAIEGLRVRYLQSVPHGSVPEAGVAESAIVLQHKARELIARAGLRPDGVAQQQLQQQQHPSSSHMTALIPAAAVKRRGSPAPLSPRSYLMLGGSGSGGPATPLSGMSTPPLRSPPWSQKRSQQGGSSSAAAHHRGGQHGQQHLSLLTTIPRSPFDSSPSADAYEVLLGSDSEDDDDGASRSDITFRYEHGTANGGDGGESPAGGGSSSNSSVVSSDDDQERAALIRSAFRDPFVPLKREVQEILGPHGTWVPPQQQQGSTGGQQSAAQQQKQKVDAMQSSTVSAATAAPQHQSTTQQPDNDGRELSREPNPHNHHNMITGNISATTSPQSHAYQQQHHHHHVSQRSSLSGSQRHTENDPFLQGSTMRPTNAAPPQPSETERRTQALIDKLRAGILDASKQQQLQHAEQHLQYQFQHGGSTAALVSPEPSMILDAPPTTTQQQQQQPQHHPRRSLGATSSTSPYRDQRPKPLLQVLRRDELDDHNNDAASDAESLQFHEEDRHAPPAATGASANSLADRTSSVADPLDNTIVPSKSDEARRQRGPTPTKRSSPPRPTAASDGPRLSRATSSGLNKSPNRTAKNSALDDALAAAGGAARTTAGRVTSPNAQQQRRSPMLASSRFQLSPGSDAAVLQQQQQQRHRSPTPSMRIPPAMGKQPSSRMISPDPERSPSREDFGNVEHSLATHPSSASVLDPGSRRCKWCKNVAPESHDDRCALRKIRCKKCQKILMLKERNSHNCGS